MKDTLTQADKVTVKPYYDIKIAMSLKTSCIYIGHSEI